MLKTTAIVEIVAAFVLLIGYGMNAYVARELHKLAVALRDLTTSLVKIRPTITVHMAEPPTVSGEPIGHTLREIRRAKQKGKMK